MSLGVFCRLFACWLCCATISENVVLHCRKIV